MKNQPLAEANRTSSVHNIRPPAGLSMNRLRTTASGKPQLPCTSTMAA